MGQPLIQVDAFTDRPFRGNPAAVCVLPGPADAGWMQSVAREMNLSETAFLHREEGVFRLRWFTPSVEVALCGHATLASAHVLWSEGHLAPSAQARFATLSGLLTAERRGDWIELDFPLEPAVAGDAPAEILDSLGAPAVWVGADRNGRYLIELASEAAVRELRPDFARMASRPNHGVIVTARAGTPGVDFVSRFFAPNLGIDEDPVTGSAHCALAPYWAERLGRTEMTGHQVSARGGVVRVGMAGERVTLQGQAVTVLRGELTGAAGAAA